MNGKTVLVVDDTATIRATVVIALESAGYTVIEATGADDALRQLDQGIRAHLIISDFNMPPGMNGLQLLEKLRVHPASKYLPVIMLTTENGSDLREQGRKAGARAWMTKPFKPTELIDAVNKLVLRLPAG